MSILDELNERIARHRNRDFLKGAMAASALAAQADGTVTLSERYRIDDILARLERLKIYDPHKAVQILDEFLTELRDNPEAAEGGAARQAQAHLRGPGGGRAHRAHRAFGERIRRRVQRTRARPVRRDLRGARLFPRTLPRRAADGGMTEGGLVVRISAYGVGTVEAVPWPEFRFLAMNGHQG